MKKRVKKKMYKLRKRAMLVILLTMLTLSLIPAMPVMALNPPDLYNDSMDSTTDEGDKGDTIFVTGPAGEVTAGADINVYWDSVKAWDGEKGLLNSSEGKSSGAYEVWFDVPEAVAGDHYVWVKDMDTGDTASRSFLVLSKVTVSPSSGLEDDTMTIKGYGYDDENDVAVILVNQDTLPDGTNEIGESCVSTGDIDGIETEYDFTLDNKPLEPGSAVFAVTDGVETFTDDGDGTLTGDMGGSGTVNYVTGEVEVEFDTAPTGYTAITADYEYYEDATDTIYLISTTVDSDELGSFVKETKVPEDTEMAAGQYYVHAYDAKGNTDDDDFAIGAVILLDVEEGPTGTVVEIRGRGYDPAEYINYGEITITDGSNPVDCYIVDEPALGVDVKDDGDFKLDIVIPTVSDLDDYDTIEVTDGVTPAAEADFEVTGDAEIEVDPEYGVQGATISIQGWNFTQISGEEVDIELWDQDLTAKVEDIKTFDTDSDGEFDGTFTVPAVAGDAYKIVAVMDDATFNIDADAGFRVGLMIVILSESSGPTGKEITLTGTGFTENDSWNASFGDISIFDSELTDGTGSLSESFYVPNVDVGTYTVTVLDEDTEIEVESEFTVTATAMVELDPMNAPHKYNVSIEGWHFIANEGDDIEAVLYNVTDDGDVDEDWDIDLKHKWDHDDDDDTPGQERDAVLNEDGNFSAYFMVLDEDDLSLGDYILNITTENPGDGPDIMAQVEFSVVTETISIEPRKSSFAIGDTVAFNIESSFAQDDSYIEIYDPEGTLYWKTDPIDEWVKVGTIRLVPFYGQSVNGYPMTLPTDAPLGTWSWEYYDVDDDELDSGTFTVTAAPADILADQLAELTGDMESLTTDFTGLTEDVAALSGAVSTLADSVSSAVSAANAAKAAADDAADAISEIATTANSAKDAADSAKAAAEAAKESADAAGDAASGLTTLVYGAIGASLIAALAAIVSLMQISRRIAG
jgi:uncharacterized protein YoxC